MEALTVNGVYRDGQIELEREPDGLRYAPVRVTFLTPAVAEKHAPGIPERSSGESDPSESRNAILARVLGRMEEGVDLGGAPYEPRKELDERLQPWR